MYSESLVLSLCQRDGITPTPDQLERITREINQVIVPHANGMDPEINIIELEDHNYKIVASLTFTGGY